MRKKVHNFIVCLIVAVSIILGYLSIAMYFWYGNPIWKAVYGVSIIVQILFVWSNCELRRRV